MNEENNKIKKAIILGRVSSKEQQEGFSLDSQIKLLREYASNRNMKTVKEFVLPETASKSGDRKLFKEMVEFLGKKGNVKIILVEKVDRLTRNYKDAVLMNDWLNEDLEREIHFVKQNLIIHKNAKSHEKFQWDIYIAIAHQYSNNLSEETKKGLQEKFNQGYWPGWAPLGYLNKEIDEKKTTIPDPEKWHLVRKAFKMYSTGNYSVVKIVEELYKEGLTSKTGKKVPYSIMTDTLRNSFYAGLMKWNGQEKMGQYQPMIALEEHRQILTIMDSHNQHACRRRKHNFLLRGFVFCDICGQRYTAEKHRIGKNPDYYHCSAKTVKHSNRNQNIETTQLEKQVEEEFKNIQFCQEFIDMTIGKVKKVYQEKRNGIDSQKRILLNKKIKLEEKRRIAEEKLIAGTLTDDDFIRIRGRVKEGLNLVQEEIDELDNQHDIDVDTTRETLILSKDVYTAYKEAPDEIKRLYLSFFWDKIWVKDKKIVRTKPTELIDVLLKEKQIIISPNWLP